MLSKCVTGFCLSLSGMQFPYIALWIKIIGKHGIALVRINRCCSHFLPAVLIKWLLCFV